MAGAAPSDCEIVLVQADSLPATIAFWSGIPVREVLVRAAEVRGTAGELRLEERRRLELDVPYPHGVALTPDGAMAFVTYEGEQGRGAGVVAVSTSDGSQAWVTEVGAYLLGVAYHAPASRR